MDFFLEARSCGDFSARNTHARRRNQHPLIELSLVAWLLLVSLLEFVSLRLAEIVRA